MHFEPTFASRFSFRALVIWQDPRVHTDLALSYVADIFARGDEPNPHLKLCDDWGSESQSRQRLLHHLWSSNMIQAGQVLDQLQNTGKIPAKRDDGIISLSTNMWRSEDKI